ncbi:MAG: hypothetical protein J1F64_05855 [Oscillospiraceae bacterium]|nr:hypothetical protein [Oscillospiraceae bacterium]
MKNTETLKNNIKKELDAFVGELKNLTAEAVIEQAELLAAMKKAYRHIADHDLISDNEAEYFLGVERPLRGIAEYFMDANDNLEGFSLLIWEITDKDLLA